MSNATTTSEALRSAEDALRRQADDLALRSTRTDRESAEREALRSAEDALRRQADDLAELAQSLR